MNKRIGVHRKKATQVGSIPTLKERLKRTSGSGTPSDRVSALRLLSRALVREERDREAIPILWLTSVLQREMNNSAEATISLCLLGSCFDKINKIVSASRAYRMAIEISDRSKNLFDVFFFGLVLVCHLWRHDLPIEALTTAYDILRRSRAGEIVCGLKKLQDCVSGLNDEIGDPYLSIAIAESVAMEPEIGLEVLAWHERTMGELYHSVGRVWQAQELMREAVANFLKVGLSDEAVEAKALLHQFQNKPRIIRFTGLNFDNDRKFH